MSAVTENVKRYIVEKGLKQKYVAECMEMTPQSFCDMLNGRKEFKIEYVAPICNILGVTANDLFAKPDKPVQTT